MDAVSLPSPSFTFLQSPRLHGRRQPESISPLSARNSGKMPLRPVAKGCRTCGGKGAIECPGCKGTGKNKNNGNIFERWKVALVVAREDSPQSRGGKDRQQSNFIDMCMI